jgi:hypothetical protein
VRTFAQGAEPDALMGFIQDFVTPSSLLLLEFDGIMEVGFLALFRNFARLALLARSVEYRQAVMGTV